MEKERKRKRARGIHEGPTKDEEEEYAGGPNPPAVRSYRRYKHFSRNNSQRLEKRLIDCPTHDFACKGVPAQLFFPEEFLHANAIPPPAQKSGNDERMIDGN